MFDSISRRSAAAAALVFAGFNAQAAFDIQVNLAGVADPALQLHFAAAESFWESVITDYQGVGIGAPLIINASVSVLDPSLLGQAGPTGFATPTPGGFTYTTAGVMEFNSLYLSSYGSLFSAVVMHEMAHVIGFGTVWGVNGLYGAQGEYSGALALATYQTEFRQSTAAFVPVELEGGIGTMDTHWDEWAGGLFNTGVVDAQGRDFRHELMTGWLSPNSFVSQTTIASFADIGYTVNLAPVPETSTYLLWLLGAPALVAWTRKRKQSSK